METSKSSALSDGAALHHRPSEADQRLLRTVLAPWRKLTDPWFHGLENIPADGPVLLVGNHSTYAFVDMPLMFEEIHRVRGRFVRGLADHAHFVVPGWRDVLTRGGAVRGTRENCRVLLGAGEAVLVYPGGGREVAKRKGEKYQLLWKQRTGFARMAIEAGCPIVPFGAVGAEESYEILLDADHPVSRRCARSSSGSAVAGTSCGRSPGASGRRRCPGRSGCTSPSASPSRPPAGPPKTPTTPREPYEIRYGTRSRSSSSSYWPNGSGKPVRAEPGSHGVGIPSSPGRGRALAALALAAFAATILAVVAIVAFRQGETSDGRSTRAEDWVLPALDGNGQVALADFRGIRVATLVQPLNAQCDRAHRRRDPHVPTVRLTSDP